MDDGDVTFGTVNLDSLGGDTYEGEYHVANVTHQYN
jgi:hypothetical protein